MFIIFPNDWRKLRRLITGLLKSWLTTEVIRMNYLQSYALLSGAETRKNDQIKKSDLKLLYLVTEQAEKVESFLEKGFPEARILEK